MEAAVDPHFRRLDIAVLAAAILVKMYWKRRLNEELKNEVFKGFPTEVWILIIHLTFSSLENNIIWIGPSCVHDSVSNIYITQIFSDEKSLPNSHLAIQVPAAKMDFLGRLWPVISLYYMGDQETPLVKRMDLQLWSIMFCSMQNRVQDTGHRYLPPKCIWVSWGTHRNS